MLVTGPTGSGKTTTLYACLSEINSPDINILTVEDPVEYQLEGISQTQVNSKIDLTFASGLRSFLRQDPDVIMVGEIRDRETAEVAITASLTGHLVFSTVHTNDAAGGITRLVDMGIEPFLVAIVARRSARPAPRAPAVLRVRAPGAPVARRCCASSASTPRRSAPAATTSRTSRACARRRRAPCSSRSAARRASELGYKRPYRHLRAADDQRAGSPARARQGGRRLDPQRRGRGRHGRRCASTARARSCSGMTTPEEVMLMTAESAD